MLRKSMKNDNQASGSHFWLFDTDSDSTDETSSDQETEEIVSLTSDVNKEVIDENKVT